MSNRTLLKDQLVGEEKLDLLIEGLAEAYPEMDIILFKKNILERLPKLELKERITHISKMLKKHLPNDYEKATEIILKALPNELDNGETDNDFGEFIYSAYSEYIAMYGLEENNLQHSLYMLFEITKRFTAEYAIRIFLNKYPRETLLYLNRWTESENYHVRRLVSEGLRPRLPWGKKIFIRHELGVLVLNNLYYDKTRFVTRSVANHLNDVSKTNPILVLNTLKLWNTTNLQDKKEMQYINRHSLRTLVKQGNKDAFSFLEYTINPKMQLKNFKVKNEKIKIGEIFEFSFGINAKEDLKLMVDYNMYFRRKDGEFSKKTHKIKTVSIKKGSYETFLKKHPIKKNMTTRSFYPGIHKMEIMVNGEILKEVYFEINI